MSNRDNILLKLDILQYHFLRLRPRLSKTRQLCNSKTKDKIKLLQLSKETAIKTIKEYQIVLFNRKYHSVHGKILKNLVRIIKKESKLKAAMEELLVDNNELLEKNLKYKLEKILLKIFKRNMESVPDWFRDDVNNFKIANPYKTNSKSVNDLISKAFSDKSVKELIQHMNDSFRLILEPVDKEKLIDEDREEENFEIERVEEDGSEDRNEDQDKEDQDVDVDKQYDQLYDIYKDALIASSDDETEQESELDPNVNYNEITDEEPEEDSENSSEEDLDPAKIDSDTIENDDFFSSKPDKKSTKKSKKEVILPALASGYYSGNDSDTDIEDDEIVENTTKPIRKNRRGQRARQKIWEMKYGSKAVHLIKQQERYRSERERLKDEYDARVIKRAEKEKLRKQRQLERDTKLNKDRERNEKMHPSWEAKRKLEESMQNVKFQGKKMKFD